MTTIEKHIEERNKILEGLNLAYKKLLEFKRQKGTALVVIRNNKVVKLKVK